MYSVKNKTTKQNKQTNKTHTHNSFSSCLSLQPAKYYQSNTCLNAAVPNLFGTKDWFHRRQFSMDGVGVGVGRGFRMIQVHYIYCVLYFYSYNINSTSDHQALDSGVWGPLVWTTGHLHFTCFLPAIPWAECLSHMASNPAILEMKQPKGRKAK